MTTPTTIEISLNCLIMDGKPFGKPEADEWLENKAAHWLSLAQVAIQHPPIAEAAAVAAWFLIDDVKAISAVARRLCAATESTSLRFELADESLAAERAIAIAEVMVLHQACEGPPGDGSDKVCIELLEGARRLQDVDHVSGFSSTTQGEQE